MVLVVLANLDEEGRHRRRAPARELAGLPGRVGVGAGRVRLTARVMAMVVTAASPSGARQVCTSTARWRWRPC